MAGFTKVFLFHEASQHQHLRHQGRQDVFPGHLRELHATGSTRWTVNSLSQAAFGRGWVHLQTILGIMISRLRHAHVHARPGVPHEKPVLLQPPFILNFGRDAFIAEELSEALGGGERVE